jgi:hypothetical protein
MAQALAQTVSSGCSTQPYICVDKEMVTHTTGILHADQNSCKITTEWSSHDMLETLKPGHYRVAQEPRLIFVYEDVLDNDFVKFCTNMG